MEPVSQLYILNTVLSIAIYTAKCRRYNHNQSKGIKPRVTGIRLALGYACDYTRIELIRSDTNTKHNDDNKYLDHLATFTNLIIAELT